MEAAGRAQAVQSVKKIEVARLPQVIYSQLSSSTCRPLMCRVMGLACGCLFEKKVRRQAGSAHLGFQPSKLKDCSMPQKGHTQGSYPNDLVDRVLPVTLNA